MSATTWETVIGLEIHAQLSTRSKIFSGAATSYGARPNVNASLVDLGYPGVLPVLNGDVVRMAVKLGLAIGASIAGTSIFARKNYFYPDLPKGYQISQYELPIVAKGSLDIVLEDGTHKRIGITRAHLEEDAGKSLHEGLPGVTGIDLNRAGTPLIEIVSEPEMRSAKEAVAYMKKVHTLVRYLEICDGNMQEGSFRCDANVSVRLKGAEKFGTKVEVKNLNSFRFAKMAIDFEIARQVGVVESGGRIEQESRLYNVATGETVGMRSKEHAHDYRYFPEPDLVPLRVSAVWLEQIRATVPELPAEKRARFMESYGLREYDAQVLTATRDISEYFEKAAKTAGDRRLAANWVTGDLLGALKGSDITESPVSPEHLGELVAFIAKGDISGKMAKDIFAKMFETGESAAAIIDREGLRQISDTGALEKIVDEVIAQSPKQVEQYKSGKTGVIGYLVGQVMKLSKGQANPAAVNELLKAKLQ